jgi:hypothetical protein
VLLRQGGKRRPQTLLVLKLRGSDHAKDIRRFSITMKDRCSDKFLAARNYERSPRT